MISSRISKRIRIGGQLLLLAGLYYFLLINYTGNIPNADRATVLWVVHFDFTVLTAGVYISTLILFPRLFAKERYAAFAAAYFLMITIGGLAIIVDDWVVLTSVEEKKQETAGDIALFFLSSAGVMLIISGVGLGVRGIVNWMQSVRQLNLIKEESLKTEVAFLRSQMNPHFLFNTINLIFGHIDKENKTARDMMLRFSELMRYQLYECDVTMIDIDKEVGYLQHYIELQKLRKNEDLHCSFTRQGKLSGFTITPLLMVPIVENAFKYLSCHKDKRNFLNIDMSRSDHQFHFSCSNTKSGFHMEEIVKSNGIGLQNVRRRLELIYPDKHTLSVLDSEETFEVRLTIAI